MRIARDAARRLGHVPRRGHSSASSPPLTGLCLACLSSARGLLSIAGQVVHHASWKNVPYVHISALPHHPSDLETPHCLVVNVSTQSSVCVVSQPTPAQVFLPTAMPTAERKMPTGWQLPELSGNGKTTSLSQPKQRTLPTEIPSALCRGVKEALPGYCRSPNSSAYTREVRTHCSRAPSH